MSNYLVSARKYRPQDFNSVVGQSHITTTLKNAIKSGQVAHAFLFCGPRGVGKTTCARILAKTINCQNITKEGEACNSCENCQLFNKGTSFNIHELDAASNNKVEDIKEIIEQVRYAPPSGKFKIYIIDEVHMLSNSAFNVFLKTLEEPPPYVIFILATTEKQKIIPTILSRCQIFEFKRIIINDTVEQLAKIISAENIQAEKSALELIALKSEGCLRDSLSLLDKIASFTSGNITYNNTLEHLNILDEQSFFPLLILLQHNNLNECLKWNDDLYKKGFDSLTVIQTFQNFLRNILVAQKTNTQYLLEVPEMLKSQYLEVAQNVDFFYIISMLNILQNAEWQYKESNNKRLHIEMVLIKLAFLNQVVESVSSQENEKITVHFNNEKPSLLRTVSLRRRFSPPPPVNIPLDKPLDIDSKKEINYSNNKKTILDLQVPPSSQINIIEYLKLQYDNINIIEIEQPLEIVEQKLCEIWQNFIQVLEAKHLNLQLKDVFFENIRHDSFTLVFPSTIARSFFESKKDDFIESVKKTFKNNYIRYDFRINAVPSNSTNLQNTNTAKLINKNEKFQRIINNYPEVKKFIKELKLVPINYGNH